ncbi:MAG: diaminopimelate epimerase [Actinomycetota bacterium]
MQVTLTKHQALGNDFLVYDLAQGVPSVAWRDLAQRWCDRRFGIGADGLLILENHGERRLSMTLHNADGSVAEISGNGIRCLVQAAHSNDRLPSGVTYEVATDAGVRHVAVVADDGAGTIQASVDMGVVADLPQPTGWDVLGCQPDRPVAHLSLGNPHSVVAVDDVRAVSLEELGGKVPHVNLEIVEAGPEDDAVTMRVHERGAGVTLACGSGACAAAYAAKRWGFVHPTTSEVVVHMDGGDARVRIDDGTRIATLVGPSTFIATAAVNV